MRVDNVIGRCQSQQTDGRGKISWDIQQAQETIYNYFLEIVRTWEASKVLTVFRQLFIHNLDSHDSNVLAALHIILLSHREDEFRNTLKRTCYVLINNWEIARNHHAIQQLVDIISDSTIHQAAISPILRCLRRWLVNFTRSKDYQDLRFLSSRHTKTKHWTHRYTSYLLVSQYMDSSNPIEQREIAYALSKKLKDEFKFQLAMYTAYSQTDSLFKKTTVENPTGLGDNLLLWIKKILVRRGIFDYKNLANIFLKQSQTLRYQSFKQSLKKYLMFLMPDDVDNQIFERELLNKLEHLYPHLDNEEVNDALLLRTCNRLIEYLITEDRIQPSPLFNFFRAQNNSMTLAILLLKIALICPKSRAHLEARIADLVRYFEALSEEDCKGVVNFFEVFHIAFTIYSDNVEYNLVPNRTKPVDQKDGERESNLEGCQIFSRIMIQQRREIPKKVFQHQS
ncbi:MAG: hypothetical protein QNJ46_25540 [Leptolyngbyaceae cyanobacterium MO_188.B28]|nr:hypothetical protein [Leptolyngbyaceae cyanobacterium MO_188.B28]